MNTHFLNVGFFLHSPPQSDSLNEEHIVDLIINIFFYLSPVSAATHKSKAPQNLFFKQSSPQSDSLNEEPTVTLIINNFPIYHHSSPFLPHFQGEEISAICFSNP